MEKSVQNTYSNWYEVSLRVPLFVFMLGAFAALYQTFPDLWISTSGLIPSIQYIGGIVALFAIFELTKLNEKRVNIVFAICLIALALSADLLF